MERTTILLGPLILRAEAKIWHRSASDSSQMKIALFYTHIC